VDNVVTNLCAKFNDDRLWNEKALVDRKFDNNPKKNNDKNNVGGPFPGLKTFSSVEGCGRLLRTRFVTLLDLQSRDTKLGRNTVALIIHAVALKWQWIASVPLLVIFILCIHFVYLVV